MGQMIAPDLSKPMAPHYLDYQGPLGSHEYVAIERDSGKVTFCSKSMFKVLKYIKDHS